MLRNTDKDEMTRGPWRADRVSGKMIPRMNPANMDPATVLSIKGYGERDIMLCIARDGNHMSNEMVANVIAMAKTPELMDALAYMIKRACPGGENMRECASTCSKHCRVREYRKLLLAARGIAHA